MSTYGKKDIMRSMGYGDLEIENDQQDQLAIEPASIDVHLADSLLFEAEQEHAIDVTDEKSFPWYYQRDMDGGYQIESKEFVLGTTQETFTIPNGCVGYLHGRSSVGRLGMFVENAGLIDPNFNGEITLELYNASKNDIKLQEGMRIAQLTLHDIETAPDVGYSEQNGNKYQGQSDPTKSRLYEDFE